MTLRNDSNPRSLLHLLYLFAVHSHRRKLIFLKLLFFHCKLFVFISFLKVIQCLKTIFHVGVKISRYVCWKINNISHSAVKKFNTEVVNCS